MNKMQINGYLRQIVPVVLLACALLLTGCGMNTGTEFMSEVRKENGLVIILPGIEGESGFNHNIRRGLVSAGCFRAMPIYNWGLPIPGIGLIINQSSLGKKAVGQVIAKEIEQYQDSYPGRPVYVVGHSGGGGIAVFVAEGMSPGRKLDGLVLLAASISNTYNLSKALSHCKNGLVNYYNPDDVGLLGVGTTIVGTVDGGHGVSAGLSGFKSSHPRVFQVKVTSNMTLRYGGGAHDAATRPGFVSRYVAPWVLTSNWPPGGAVASR
jgi:hypothetical protein